MCHVFLLGIVLSVSTNGAGQESDERDYTLPIPCARSSLYMYEKLTGTAVTFKDVEAKLRVGVDGTASFADIKDAASSFGTRLRAKRLTPEDRIDRIMIVALKRGTQGHFVVVRPVGHTGNLVQVFDTTEEPQVLDESIFRAQHGWTGNVLVEAAWRDWLGYGWIAAGLLCCCAALVTRLRLPFSWSRQVLP